ncbi:MAG TPA: GTPase [Limnochordia bacterium]|nr:GTPase [Limnochordia bacterium]
MSGRRLIVIGKTSVGKTVFTLNFAAYLGQREVEIAVTSADGATRRQRLPVAAAIRRLSGDAPHQTRALHAITLSLPAGKGEKRFDIVDTSGLIDGIHADAEIRRAMAQTLSAVREAQMILHVVDASAAGREGAVAAFGEVDFQVAHFAQMRGAYAILANKMDLPGAEKGLGVIRQEFVGHTILPISALHSDGFGEVKRFVWRAL